MAVHVIGYILLGLLVAYAATNIVLLAIKVVQNKKARAEQALAAKQEDGEETKKEEK